MTGVVPVIPKIAFNSASGTPLSGGSVTVYSAGTTTPLDTWQDVSQFILNTNPIILDSRGECLLIVDPNLTYKFVVKDSSGVAQYTVDNVVGAGSQAGFATTLAAAVATATAAAAASATAAATSATTATAASATSGAYPNSAASAVPRQIVQSGVGAITAGSGGTNGTFNAAFSAGTGWLIYPTATFTVAGGALTAFTITSGGLCISASFAVPAVSFAASAGLTGAAVALTSSVIIASGSGYWVTSSDGFQLDHYVNSAGVATADPTVASVPSSSQFPVLSGVTPVWALADDKGNTAAEVDTAGAFSVADLKTLRLNGCSTAALRPSPIALLGELMLVNNTGQSLASGQVPAITTAQEYDTLGFPFWAVSPAATLTATAANLSQLSAGSLPCEPPMFGFAAYLKQLLEAENNLRYTDHKMQLVLCDNSHGSFAIAALNKGTSLYNGAITQATSVKTIADASNLIGAVAATLWTQGEADTGSSIATYQAALSQLANDYNTDYKAQTGQTWDVPFISYQTGSTPGSNPALAQRAASLANSLISIACSMGVFDYQDNLHINPESTKWLGAYYALCWKRRMLDGQTWKALRPLQVVGGGVGKKFVNIKFDCMVKPLVIDTTQIPAQSQNGFSTVTSGAVDIPITAISVVAPDVVKFEYGSNLPVGAEWRSGFLAATGKGPYVGAAVNLRDSQGDTVPLFANVRRMDNWGGIDKLPL